MKINLIKMKSKLINNIYRVLIGINGTLAVVAFSLLAYNLVVEVAEFIY